jgi:hypothetical protein
MPQTNSEAVGYECVEMQLKRFAAACYHKPVAEWAQQCHRPTARHLARSASDYKERFAAAGITSQWPSWCSNATDP